MGKFRDMIMNESKDSGYETLLDSANKYTTNIKWKISKDGTYKLKNFYKIQTDSVVKGNFEESNSGILISFNDEIKKFTITEYVDSEEKSYSFSSNDENKFWKYVEEYFKD